MTVKVSELIRNIANKLINSCKTKHEANQEAWWILEEITQKKELNLLLEEEINLSKEQKIKLNEWIKQIVEQKKPIQYILGHVPFCNLDIIVEPPVLIPRPETEEICFWLINQLKKIKDQKFTVLDIGTGSGCIALCIAKEFPNSIVIGSDINPKALELAEKNKRHNFISNAFFIQSDFYKNIYQEIKKIKSDIKNFDLIVSNPPYISPEEFKNLSETITLWEDKNALIANEDGFYAYKEIINHAKDYLILNTEFKNLKIPQLVLEFGKDQENKIIEILKNAKFTNIEFFKDINKIYRWIATNPCF